MSNKEKVGAKSDGSQSANENAASKTITFLNQNQNLIYGVLIAILIVIFGIIAANKFYFQPKNERGTVALLSSIALYSEGVQNNDSTKLIAALEGDGTSDGFEYIASNNKMTKIGNTAKYFIGMTHFALGDKDMALDHLTSFKKKDDVYWYSAQMTLGDIYDDMGDDAQAIKYYQKAAKGNSDYYTPNALFKLAQMYERSEKWNDAYNNYNRIKKEFYSEYESMGIERFLKHATVKAGK
ncbi:tetratricopeptide repeat protein [Bacteroidales bacterium OttesenSCG-928-C03]|nr:tetratricopeptide repeat protein [Bacteroidales bacterium OttesenSCG-928-C03]MDL2325940.1 tetratricopeptide repeat protein [Bacteroidales bacterium OttesenSCG-928-A14]